MTNPTKLTEEQIRETLAQLPKWDLQEGKLHRKLQF